MALSKIQGIEGQVTPNLGRRNLVINGAMQVAQRGTTFDYSTPSGNKFTTCDRFSFFKSTGTYELTNTQSTDAPAGFSHSWKVVNDAVYTPTGSDNLGINQNIEVSNGLQGFGFGTSEAKDITFSFYVKGTPKTYTFQTNYVGTDGEQKSQMKTFAVTNTWTRKVITFSAGGTSSSVGIEQDQTSAGMNFRVWLASGPDDISSEITTWTANPSPTYKAVTGQDNFFDVIGNEFFITGIQLEVGDTATEFEHRSYGEELLACKRYFQRIAGGESGITTSAIMTAAMHSSTFVEGIYKMEVEMRTEPSLECVTGTDYYGFSRNGALDTFNSISIDSGAGSPRQVNLYNNSQVSGTAGQSGIFFSRVEAAIVSLSAEL